MTYLSDIARKGMQGKYKIKNQLFDGMGGVCIMGAIYYGLCDDPEKSVLVWNEHCKLSARYHWFVGGDTYKATNGSAWLELIELNNYTEMTLLELADWLEKKEYELGVRK